MLDSSATRLIRPLLLVVAKRLLAMNVSANALTFFAFGAGLAASACIAFGHFGLGAALIALSRLCDGLDGAVARLTQATDRGGFLDITLDFLFYASVPLAFAVAQPLQNALAAASLLAAFMGTATSFLAFATIAAKRGLASAAYPDKSFYFLGGLTEATETLLFFLAMCIWPTHFAVLAYAFAALCGLTVLARLYWGYVAFAD